MGKTEVYSWRVSPHTKTALEHAARREGTTLAALLDRIVREWLGGSPRGSETEQQRLHAAAARCIGTIAGGGARRAENVRSLVRRRLKTRRAG